MRIVQVEVVMGVVKVIIILAMLLVTARHRMEQRDKRELYPGFDRVRRGWRLLVYRAGGWIIKVLGRLPCPGGG